MTEYTTQELSKKTWPDLERLFQKPGIGDASWCWCTFNHTASFTPENTPPTRAERAVKNRRTKKELVEKGESHGVIVYSDEGEPVGWCQYGTREELPRTDHSRKYQSLAVRDKGPLWRITCFVVDKNYRRQGVASSALKAVLESIKNQGGGLVEAFPVKETDQGPGYMCTGRLSMFEKAGFKTVGPYGTGRTATVIVRKSF
jgi:ribosomal protein S18 acetylase RimI-like enzyme